MDNNLIVIRGAQTRDVTAIERLLHSEQKSLAIAEINDNMDNLLLLFQEDKLLSVTKIKPSAQGHKEWWTVVHPMLSQTLIESGVHQLVQAVWGLKNKNC